MSKRNLLMLLILYVLATGVTYGATTLLAKKSVAKQQAAAAAQQADQAGQPGSPLGKLLTISPSEPRDQACPLNGALYTTTEKNAWSQRRPLAVMIENTPDARPQSGLTSSDLVFEAVAEYGITRFMAFYYCAAQANDVTLAPIRSAREYFFELASGFNRPLYAHVGGANTPGPADALGHIADAGWNGQNDMNEFSVGLAAYIRNGNRIPGKVVATEHTMQTSTEKLWKVAAKRGWTNVSPIPAQSTTASKKTINTVAAAAVSTGGQDWMTNFKLWNFQDGTPGAGSINSIAYSFFSGFADYAVQWQYDAGTNSYKRILAGQPHTDLNNNQQIVAKNVVTMFVTEKGPIDAEKHMLYGVTGTGDALVFQNGTVVKAKWSKKDITSELFFTDAKGQPIEFVRGQIWISLLAIGAKVAY